MTRQTDELRPSESGLPFSYANSTEDYFLLSQVIESGGKRERRLDVVGSMLAATEMERELTRRQIVARSADDAGLDLVLVGG